MGSSVNKVILVGNLGGDPEVRYLESGAVVATFSVATSETYTDRRTNEKVTQTEWHRVVLWRGLAEVAEKYLKKGHKVYLEGKLKTRSWTDKENVKRNTTEIVVDNMVMMSTKNSEITSEEKVAPKESVPETNVQKTDTVSTDSDTSSGDTSSVEDTSVDNDEISDTNSPNSEKDDLPF